MKKLFSFFRYSFGVKDDNEAQQHRAGASGGTALVMSRGERMHEPPVNFLHQ